MKLLLADLRLLSRSRFSVAALLVLLLLSLLASAAGLSAVARQNATIDRVETAQRGDLDAVTAEYTRPGSHLGNAAYYTFLSTWDRPSTLAFAALGQRDLQPQVLRVRLLGLQSQLHESETSNAELLLPGPFDFAFVLIYLAPLILVALLHDLVSGEREAGRLRLLRSMSAAGGGLWGRRALLRFGLVLGALLPPLVVGGVIAGAPVTGLLALSGISALYLAFWLGAGLWVAARARTSAAAAMGLVGAWIVSTLLIPAAVHVLITRALPVAQGIELTLAQRERVHHAWDVPLAQTYQPFFAKHPQWRDRVPMTEDFQWIWYYAMHEVGDDAVAPLVLDYRQGLAARQTWTERLGVLSPAASVQTLIHRLADTDLPAHLAYQDSIAAFHERLRGHLYPLIIEDRPLDRATFASLPTFAPRASSASMPWVPFLALCGFGLLALGAGLLGVHRHDSVGG